MKLSFAPLEGITGWIYRSVHHEMIYGVDTYYTPFFAPTPDSPLSGRGLSDMLPEHNEGVPVIPQLLCSRADAFLAAAGILESMGYREDNLNLGCPSGTVVAKRKGAGFLGVPEELDAFLDTVFSCASVKVSVKTRIGLDSEEEWPRLLEIFSRYPLAGLIVHPRLRRDRYSGPVRMGCFRYAAEHTRLPLCYNGDLNAPEDCRRVAAEFPGLDHLMAGRGLAADPAMARELAGGGALTKGELWEFHDRLMEAYRAVYSGDRPVLAKMKELWFYMGCLFPEPGKHLKRIRKAGTAAEYSAAAAALFRDRDLIPGGRFSLGRAASL